MPIRTGQHRMGQLIDSLASGVPAALAEVRTLGRTLTKRAGDILIYFDRPGTSNGPTEAIGRLGHLRGSALGFLNLTNYLEGLVRRSRTKPSSQITARDRRIPAPPSPSIETNQVRWRLDRSGPAG